MQKLIAGLPSSSRIFLKENEQRDEVPALNILGYFQVDDTQYPLHQYHLNDGRVAFEFFQGTRCSGDNVVFMIGLKVESKEYTWQSQEFDWWVGFFT